MEYNSGEKTKYIVKNKDELMAMEEKPKTKAQIILDRVIMFLPVLMALIHLAEYYYMPNYSANTNTHVYGGFIMILGAACLVGAIVSLFHRKTFYYYR